MSSCDEKPPLDRSALLLRQLLVWQSPKIKNPMLSSDEIRSQGDTVDVPYENQFGACVSMMNVNYA